jgi:hypothetical protein
VNVFEQGHAADDPPPWPRSRPRGPWSAPWFSRRCDRAGPWTSVYHGLGTWADVRLENLRLGAPRDWLLENEREREPVSGAGLTAGGEAASKISRPD